MVNLARSPAAMLSGIGAATTLNRRDRKSQVIANFAFFPRHLLAEAPIADEEDVIDNIGATDSHKK